MALSNGRYSLPESFANPLSAKVVLSGTTWRVHGISVSSIDFTLAGTHTKYYVDYQNGNDANDGLSAASAVKTFDQAAVLAQALADAAEIIIIDEWIGVQSLTTTAKTFSGNLKVRSGSPSGRTLITNKDEDVTISWSDNGDGTFSATTGTEDFPACFDNAALDSDGIATPMQSVASGATCASTAGSFFWDGVDTLMVHMTDDREPDDDFIYCPASPLGRMNCKVNTSDGVIIYENLTAYHNGGASGGGGGFGASCTQNTGPSYNTARIGITGCYSAGSNGNGFGILDFEAVILENCVTKYNRTDGFNYHVTESTTAGRYMTVYEINCKATDSGYDGIFQDQPTRTTSSNGSTAHDNMSILRIGGTYSTTYGPCIADVNGCDSLNFSCFAEDPGLSGAGSANAAFYHQSNTNEGDTHRMLLFHCTGSDTTSGSGAVTMSSVGDWGFIGHIEWQGSTPITTSGVIDEI